MARANEQKAKAIQLFEEGFSMVEIAEKLEVRPGTVRSWKNRDKLNGTEWKKIKVIPKPEKPKSATQRPKENATQRETQKSATLNATLQKEPKKRKRGKRPNKVVSEKEKANLAPKFEKGNQKALKHGAYAKYLNPQAAAVYEEASEEERIELLNEAITIKFANIIVAQKRFKHNNPAHAKADTDAMVALSKMIKDYQTLKGTTSTDTSEEDGFIEALLNDSAADDWEGEE